MAKNIFKYAKKILPFIGITILLYIVYSLDVEKIKDSLFFILQEKPVFIIAALALTLPRVLIRNYAWQFILKEQKITISFWKSLKIFLIGFFYCSITPGYIGHIMRVPYLKEETKEPYGKLFVNTIIEILLRSLSHSWMITFGLILVLDILPEINNVLILWTIWISINITIILYMIKKDRGEKLLYLLIKIMIPKRYRKNLEKFISTFYQDFPRITKLIIPFILGVITWVIAFSQEYLFVIALNLPIPYIMFLLLFPIANLIGLIPVSFAGLGTRELTAIIIFTTLFPAVAGEEILVVSLLGFLTVDFFTGLIGFFLSLTGNTKTNSKDITV